MLTQKHQKPIIETGLKCPGCGQHTRRQWWQETGLPHRPYISQTDCVNPNCEGYYLTLDVDAFYARLSGGAK